MTAIPPKIRELVRARADGMCERCGRVRPLELHHRKFRSRGGKHTVQNLVALCGFGNTDWCHGWAHSDREAQIDGFSVASWDDETEKELLRHGVWVLLTEDGHWTSKEPAW